MKNNTQPALKERIEKALEDFTKGRASMHVPPLDTDVDVVLAECSDRLSELKARCAALAAENAMLKQRTQQLIDIISNTDNDYCMCGSAMKDHVHGGCGYPTGMFDYYYNQWLESDNKTPATDAFLAEVRAQGVDMFALMFAEEAIKSNNITTGWRAKASRAASEYAEALREDAAQLRQEAVQ